MAESSESPAAAGRRSGAYVPGPGAMLVLLATVLCPLALAAALPLLPGVARSYLVSLPLPVLVAEFALLFMILVHPLLLACGAGDCGAAAGICRGALLASLAVPFVLVAREVRPISAVETGWMWLMIGITGAGAAGAAAAWGSRGAAVAVLLCLLPGLAGYVAQDVYPAMHWLLNASPVAELGVWSGGRPSALAFAPGVVLGLAAMVLARGGAEGSQSCAR